jgi:hypothetical protein
MGFKCYNAPYDEEQKIESFEPFLAQRRILIGVYFMGMVVGE